MTKQISEYDHEKSKSHTAYPTYGIMRKSRRTFTVTRHVEDNKSKATSSLFLVKMIAKLGWT